MLKAPRAKELAERPLPAHGGPSKPHRPDASLFLAPDVQKALLEGWHTARLNLARLLASDIPLSWQSQREQLGDVLIDAAVIANPVMATRSPV